tara:strand:+ start:2127 stop:2558 length:432 start_codon:yes stop_codon:yes gene_type:complete
MNNIQSRTPYLGTDPKDGAQVVFVPLANGKGIARLLPDDFALLTASNFTMTWSFNSSGRIGKSYVRAYQANASGTNVTVARVIARALPRQCIYYRDGDPTNLRADNLCGRRGHARRDDAALVAAMIAELPMANDNQFTPNVAA